MALESSVDRGKEKGDIAGNAVHEMHATESMKSDQL